MMVDWFRSNRGWLLPALIVTGLIFLLFSYSQHLQHKKRQEVTEVGVSDQKTGSPVTRHAQIKTVTTTRASAPDRNTAIAGHTEQTAAQSAAPPAQKNHPAAKKIIAHVPITASVKPGVIAKKTSRQTVKLLPDKIIQRLAGMSVNKRKTVEKQLIGRHVKWTAFLFSAKKLGDNAFTVNFDSSSTGFGVVIVADIDLMKYIDIVAAREGDPIRISGTITAIDTNGTGQIDLIADSVDLVSSKK